MALRGYLEQMTTSGYRDSLQDLLRLTNIKPIPKRKNDMIDVLDGYLNNKENIMKIWEKLTLLEKELLEEYIRSSGSLDRDEIKEIFKIHNEEVQGRYNSYFVDYLGEKSQARLFFLSGRIPTAILNILKPFVKPIEVKLTPIEELQEDDFEDCKIIRESFERDFMKVIKLINSTKIKTTGTGLPTKTAAFKINEALENKEVEIEDFDISDIRTINDTSRVYGVYKLLLEADIIKEQGGVLSLGEKSEGFLKSNVVDKCNMLLDSYIPSKDIYELERLKGLKIQTDKHPNFERTRKLILSYIRKCPVDKWVQMNEFLRYFKKNDKGFLTKDVGEISSYDDYHRYYCSRMENWNDIEGRFIELVFLEYLSVIGILDVAMMADIADDNYGDGVIYPSVEYFRLTPLGAYILGVETNYSLPESRGNSSLIIQPNFEIVISEGTTQQIHMIYFDKFAEKISEGNVAVYKLSFAGIVNALNNGIAVDEIIEYINKNKQNGIPENVRLTLEDWNFESKRIKIRTVTIVETDDVYLMEELKSYKAIKNNMLSELTYVFEIDSKSASKVKKEIEKKNHFCGIE